MNFGLLAIRGLRTALPVSRVSLAPRMMSSAAPEKYKFETMAVTVPKEFVFHVEINRPEKLNALNKTMWKEIDACFKALADDPDCRSIVLSGAGKIFTAGLDLSEASELASMGMSGDLDIARRCKYLYKLVREYQDNFSTLEKCPKPIIAAVHSACVGGGVDMICGADIRYCTQDAWFQIKEVDLGISADVGTLQRLPKVIGSSSLVRELAFTARKLYSDEALKAGFVSRIFADKDRMLKAAISLAELIASKSPVGVQGTKVNLNYARDHPVQQSLEYHAMWNMAMLQSDDLMKAAMSMLDKTSGPPNFSKL